MAKKDKKEEKKHYFRHRNDAEWLTYDICMYYRDKVKDIKDHSVGDSRFHDLCRELVERCDVTEVQAINILNGLHLKEYVVIYENMKKSDGFSDKYDDKKEYLEWLAQKEDKENELDDYGLTDET